MQRVLPFALLLSTYIWLSGCGEPQSRNNATKKISPLPVETVTIRKEPVPVWAEFTGTTRASSEQEVRARVSGRLEKRFFKDGDLVKKGQKLFLIEQDRYKAALKSALAAKKKHLAELKLAKANVERYEPLAKEGLAPRIKLEEYISQYEKVKADILSDEARIEEAQLNLDYTVVRSPVDGMIGVRHVDVGNLVGYGEPTLLATVRKFDPIYLYFSPSATEARVLRKFHTSGRMDALLRIPSNDSHIGDNRLRGFVDFSDNTVDPTTSTIKMRATFPNKEMRVYPGSFGYVEVFITDKEPIMAIPPIAIFEDQRGKFVYTVGRDGKAVRTGIEIGLMTRHFIQIEKGLKEGDRVIVSGLTRVTPGMPVEPTDATEKKGVMAVMKLERYVPAAD